MIEEDVEPRECEARFSPTVRCADYDGHDGEHTACVAYSTHGVKFDKYGTLTWRD